MSMFNRIIIAIARSATKRIATVDNLNELASTITTEALARAVSDPSRLRSVCALVSTIAPIAQQTADAIADGTLTTDEASRISESIATAIRGATITDADIACAVDAVFNRIIDMV